MLTRLKVSGFKNLVDVDIAFGPFTCIAGANGVGKSNLFDAIRFLSYLADHSMMEAARSVRDEERHGSDMRSLFYRMGEQVADTISLEAEMVVPATGVDDLGQLAKATTTFLTYRLQIGLRPDELIPGNSGLVIREEQLSHINLGEARAHLGFHHSKAWRDSAVHGRRTGPFISTEQSESGTQIKVHQDKHAGRPFARSADNLPRTVLSVANAAESPTALLARLEMRSWRLLQLEPSELARPDELTAPSHLGTDGSHLAATIYRLANQIRNGTHAENIFSDMHILDQIANRLSELVGDVRGVSIDKDERRQLIGITITDRNGTVLPAQSLSAGTLRFLALAVLEADPGEHGVLCLEEPENGIHPKRIERMLEILQDIATDPQILLGLDNPLRQVIINTHSPAVVQMVPEDSLIIAERADVVPIGARNRGIRFACLSDTWRAAGSNPMEVMPKGRLLDYLGIIPSDEQSDRQLIRHSQLAPIIRRVRDREDVKQMRLDLAGID